MIKVTTNGASNNKPSNKNIVIIMGMHRSGTSCLAGCLQEMGLFLGDVVTAAPHNKKGNRENKSLYLLHEKVLNSQGASWDKPALVDKWQPEHLDELQKIIEAYSSQQQWGFKDPRVLFTLPGWLELLPDCHFTFIASLRHPAKVAASLSTRNKFTQAEGFALWEAYNRQLLALMAVYPIKLIDFDLCEDDYKESLKLLLPQIINSKSRSATDSFYEKQLINQSQQNVLPSPIEAIYTALLAKTLK